MSSSWIHLPFLVFYYIYQYLGGEQPGISGNYLSWTACQFFVCLFLCVYLFVFTWEDSRAGRQGHEKILETLILKSSS